MASTIKRRKLLRDDLRPDAPSAPYSHKKDGRLLPGRLGLGRDTVPERKTPDDSPSNRVPMVDCAVGLRGGDRAV